MSRAKNTEDITGIKYNRLTAISLSEKRGSHGEYYWNCECECGNKTVVRSDCIRKGSIKSCGCISYPNLIGKQFNKLTVISDTGKRTIGRKAGERIWSCKCDCGKTTEISTSRLTKFRTKSCGCLRQRRQNKSPFWKGHKDISANFWYRIMTEAKNRDIEVGITIEDAWSQFEKQRGICSLSGIELSFEKFSKDDMGRTASLDRIDSKKGYTKDNIQWIHKNINWMKTKFEQSYFIEMCDRISKYRNKQE